MPSPTSPLRRVAILAVGQELLGTDRLDTNSLWITERLEEWGLLLHEKQVCGDDQADIEDRLADLLARHDLVLVTGGLGPTADDRTKESAAALLGRGLIRDEAIVASLKERFRRRGYEMPEINLKQADLVEGAVVLRNSRGTAPGFLIEAGEKVLILMPGVPVEMQSMMVEEVRPRLAPRVPSDGIVRRTVRVASLPESAVEAKVKPVYQKWPGVTFTILAAPGDIVLRFTAPGPASSAMVLLDSIERDFRESIGDAVYGRDDDSLESVVVGLLRSRGESLAAAESCSGGLLSKRITDVPGASRVFLGSLITYSNESKVRDATVPAEELEAHGAVSREVALSLARGARARFGSTYALSVTGIAGPDGGSDQKPVGTVHIALASPRGERHIEFSLPSDRAMIRSYSATIALDLLRKELLRLDLSRERPDRSGQEGM